ncbi:MAG: VTT domain-containing protein [Pseudomonadota bacterium]
MSGNKVETNSGERPTTVRPTLLLLGLLVVAFASIAVWSLEFPIWMAIGEGLFGKIDALQQRSIMQFNEGMDALQSLPMPLQVGSSILIYTVAVIFAAPASFLTFSYTLLFGWWAIAITWAGATIGQSIAFAVARTFFAKHLSWFCDRYRITRGIENAVANDGFRIVLLMRQSPIIPFAAQNYLFGMMRTKTRDYLIASALGIIPGTVAKVIVFQLASSAVGEDTSLLIGAVLVVGVLATVAVTVIIGKYVRKELTVFA